MKTRSMCKAERSPLDRISALPQPVIETILCLLESTKLAAQTSILSREWRYKWTTIPKLELWCHYRSLEFLDVCEQISDIPKRKKDIGIRCKLSYNMYHILLQRQGPIHELTINLPDGNCLDLDKIIFYSSRNHPVKKLTLIGWDSFDYWYQLPECIFSFHHLTHLDLRYVDLLHLPLSDGFGSLVSLFLRYVGISKKALIHLLRKCPSLKSLSLFIEDLHDYCTVNELFECLPPIEHLTTWPLAADRVLALVPKAPPTYLIHLKYLCFQDVDCFDHHGLAFLLLIIKCSPNLQKIKIQYGELDYDIEEYAVAWEDYSDVWLEHLSELDFRWFRNKEPEMKFVKFILARSPKLKKVRLRYGSLVDREMKMLKTLLRAPRVSPVVITVGY